MKGRPRWALMLCLFAGLAGRAGGQQQPEFRISLGGEQEFSVGLRAHRGYAVIPVSYFRSLGWTVDQSTSAAELTGPDGTRIRIVGGSPFIEWGEGESLQLALAPYLADGELMVPLQVAVEILPRRFPDEYSFDGPSMTLSVLDEERLELAAPQAPGDRTVGARPEGPIRVHLECQGFNCWDIDGFRREIPVVDWMPDPEDSDLHVLVTTRTTRGGSREYTMAFAGLRAYEGQNQDEFVDVPGDATDDDVRFAIGQRLRLGLARYLLATPAADGLRISLIDPAQSRQVDTGANRSTRRLAFGFGPVFPVYPYLVADPWRIGVGGTLRLGFRSGSRVSFRLAAAYSHLIFNSEGYFGALPPAIDEPITVATGEESASVTTGSGEIALALAGLDSGVQPQVYVGFGVGRMSSVRVPLPEDLTWTTLRRTQALGPMASGGTELSISAGSLAVLLSAEYSVVFLTSWGRRGYPQFVRIQLALSGSP